MLLRNALCALTLFVLLGAVSTPVQAAPDREQVQLDVEKIREQIHETLRQADELSEAGKHTAAREKLAIADKLERKLAEHFAREQRKDYSDEELKKILHGLEYGIGSLEALGKSDLAKALKRVANEIRERRKGHREEPREEPVSRERQAAKRQIEVMRMAMKAFLEKDQHDAAERVEMAIHALELALAGRRDREANRIREQAPNRQELAELMARAGKAYREFEMVDRAEMVEGLGRRFAGQTEGRKTDRKPAANRERTRHMLEVLGMAKHGLLEAERKDLAEKVEHLMHAIELSLEGRRDAEARKIMETAPRGENMIEILNFAAAKWDEFGHETKAATIRKLTREWQGAHGKEPARGRSAERAADREKQLAELQKQIAEMAEMMEHLRKQVEEMKRQMR